MTKLYFLAFTGFFFIRNILMPLAHDDYAYAFIWDGDNGGNLGLMKIGDKFEYRERVDSFGDIIKSQWTHYFTWGGRVIAHSIAQFFIWIGKPYFDVANTIVLALLVIVILKMANLPMKNATLAVVWIFFNLLFVTSESVVTMIWLTGACNYLWMCLLQLTFLFPYVKAIRERRVEFKTLPIIMLGILAGWSNEAGALATVCLTAFLILMLRRMKIFSRWILAGFIALIIGSALNVLSPGNFAQMQFIQSVNPDFNYTATLLKSHLLEGFLPIIATDLFVLLPMIYYFVKQGFKRRISETLMLAFASAGLIVPMAMMFSPKFDLRVSIISMNFVLVAATLALAEIKIKSPSIVRSITATVIILYSATLLYSDISVNRAVNEQLAYIQQHKFDDPLILKPLPISRIFEPIQLGKVASTWLEYFGGINDDEHFYLNVMIARYYGVKRIVAENH